MVDESIFIGSLNLRFEIANALGYVQVFQAYGCFLSADYRRPLSVKIGMWSIGVGFCGCLDCRANCCWSNCFESASTWVCSCSSFGLGRGRQWSIAQPVTTAMSAVSQSKSRMVNRGKIFILTSCEKALAR